MRYTAPKLATLILAALAFVGRIQAASPPSAADVGDAETFGNNVIYMGAGSGFVTLSPDCSAEPSPSPGPPTNQCFDLAGAPATTTFNATNICHIKLPSNSTRNVIYPALNFFVDYQLQNTTGVPQPQGLFDFVASVDIESDVLNDPSVIDPGTGLPAGGRITAEFTYRYRDDRSMDVNDRQRTRITLVRVGNTGITKAQLVSQGLSPAIVDSLFHSPMNIRMNIRGTAKLVTDASITGNMRLFGDK